MPEKSGTGGWRKRIYSRPGTAKPGLEDRPEIDIESLRPPLDRSTWRNTTHSRPATPSRAPTPSKFQVDTDDVRREGNLDVPSPRKATKPKLARYLSGYRSLKDSKEPEFGEPWSEMPPTYVEIVDPLLSVQSVFSHMVNNPTTPIPLHFNSGIFRIFEDYRNVRDKKDRLDALLHETLEGYRAAEKGYDEMEAEYQAEIRRLELLIAHGTSGMTGLMSARRDSTVKRMRTHRKTVSYDQVPELAETLSTAQLDEQIRLRSQQGMFTLVLMGQVLAAVAIHRTIADGYQELDHAEKLIGAAAFLKRPVSPSSKMAILSRRLENAQTADTFTVGTPPAQDKKATFFRKVQSEVNLTGLGVHTVDKLVPRSVESGFSGTGDPLPDEVELTLANMDSGLDLDAFLALKELGTLVARKRGIDTARFVKGLLELYSEIPETSQKAPEHEATGVDNTTNPVHSAETPFKMLSTSDHIAQHGRPQSLQRRRRHFSFEPGDDLLAAPETDALTGSTLLDTIPNGQMASSLSRGIDVHKPSKIPSPMQRPGLESIRRESSNSSMRTAIQKSGREARRGSGSSVLTAFRQSSSGSSLPVARSRSSSVHALRYGGGHSPNSSDSSGARHSLAALAAAKAAGQAEEMVVEPVAPVLDSRARASEARSPRDTDGLPEEHWPLDTLDYATLRDDAGAEEASVGE